MGLRRVLGRLAAGAPVPVFAVAGVGAREPIEDLRLDDRIRLVDTTSAASILLIAGQIPDRLAGPLARLHDSLPSPRATVFWPLGAETPPWLKEFPEHVQVHERVAETLRAIQEGLMSGGRPGERPILADEDPVPWRGVGPYGQGGTGMTGGTPYGRPMAELGPDRDGLRLDILPLKAGPFYPRFPAGLTLEVKLAGDVVVDVAAPANPFAGQGTRGVRAGLRPFIRALSEPVSIAELEVARAGEHLRWIAAALRNAELDSLGLRALRLAANLTLSDADSVRAFHRMLRWTQALGWSTGGVGRIPAAALEGLGAGPVARAAGLADDERTKDPAYSSLGFEPIVQSAGDAAARWRQRLEEVVQSLELASRANDLRTTPTGAVESPRGRLTTDGGATERLLALIPEALRGLEWGDAVTTLVSLDLDFEETPAAAVRSAEAMAS